MEENANIKCCLEFNSFLSRSAQVGIRALEVCETK